MGITGVRMFVSDKEPTTIENMIDHFDHVVKLVGIEHVGIGCDADLNGYDDMPPDQYKQLRGGLQGELRVPRQDRHRRLRPSEQDFRPDRGADPPRLLRRQHRPVLGGNFRRLLGATGPDRNHGHIKLKGRNAMLLGTRTQLLASAAAGFAVCTPAYAQDAPTAAQTAVSQATNAMSRRPTKPSRTIIRRRSWSPRRSAHRSLLDVPAIW